MTIEINMKRENNDSIFFLKWIFHIHRRRYRVISHRRRISLRTTTTNFQKIVFAAAGRRRLFVAGPAAAIRPEFVAKQQHNSGKITTAAPTTRMTTAMTKTTTTKIAQPNAGPSYFDKFIESSREGKCVTRYKCINIDRYIAEKQDYILRNDREKQRDEKIIIINCCHNNNQ